MNQTMLRKTRPLLAFLLMASACTNPEEQPEPEYTSVTVRTMDPDKTIHLDYFPNGGLRSVAIIDADSSQTLQTRFVDRTGHVGVILLRTGAGQQHVVEYYANGRPMGLTNFDSTRTSDVYYYHANGFKREEGRYENNERVGVWKRYDETGRMIMSDTIR